MAQITVTPNNLILKADSAMAEQTKALDKALSEEQLHTYLEKELGALRVHVSNNPWDIFVNFSIYVDAKVLAEIAKPIVETSPTTPWKTSYELAVERGYVGTEADWLASLSTIRTAIDVITIPTNSVDALVFMLTESGYSASAVDNVITFAVIDPSAPVV